MPENVVNVAKKTFTTSQIPSSIWRKRLQQIPSSIE